MKRSTKIRIRYQGASVLLYPAALPLSAQTMTYVAAVIRRHRKKIGSRWRKLNPGRQALLVLAYLRKGETFADLAAGFGIGDRPHSVRRHCGPHCRLPHLPARSRRDAGRTRRHS